MFKNKFYILILLPAIIITSDLFGQSIVLKQPGGGEVSELLSNVRSLTFLNGNMLFNYYDGASSSYNISSISVLYFNSEATGVDDISVSGSSGNITVYPNPASDIISFKNAPQESFYISVFRVDGKLVLNKQVSSGSNFNISNLESGVYIIKVNNQAIKFIKL